MTRNLPIGNINSNSEFGSIDQVYGQQNENGAQIKIRYPGGYSNMHLVP